MKAVTLSRIFMVVFAFGVAPDAHAAPLTKSMESTLRFWLSENPSFRLLTAADCNCDSDIRLERTTGEGNKPIPDYVPYRLVGDFRHNKQQDFAVLVTKVVPTGHQTIFALIFNAPFDAKKKQPSYFADTGSLLTNIGLFPAHNTGYPLVGAFESEGCLFVPKGKTYVKDCDTN